MSLRASRSCCLLITGHLGPDRSKPINGSTLCSQIHGVSLNCHSVIFTDTTSRTLEQFSLEASVLDGKKEVEKVDTIIGDGTSGAEDGFIDVARVFHPTGMISEKGTIFFVDTRQQKCPAYYQDIGFDKVCQSNGRHLSCLPYSF